MRHRLHGRLEAWYEQKRPLAVSDIHQAKHFFDDYIYYNSPVQEKPRRGAPCSPNLVNWQMPTADKRSLTKGPTQTTAPYSSSTKALQRSPPERSE